MTTDDADEWGVAALDLSGYLARIGYTGPLPPDVHTLTGLHRAHVDAIAFENLDLVLGRGLAVDLPSVAARLVTRRRGGLCYEHGLLFAAALQQLGLPVRRLLARIGAAVPPLRPRTHLALAVEVDGRQWLADVGFGSGLLCPLPWHDGSTARQGDWTYLLRRVAPVGWQLDERGENAWNPMYTIVVEPLHPADVVMSSHYTSTYPESPFLRRPVVVHKTDRAVHRLLGRRYSVVHADRPADDPAVEEDLTDERFVATLSRFGLELPAPEVDRLLTMV